MKTTLNDKQGRGEVSFTLLSHKVATDILLTIEFRDGAREVKMTLDREALTKAIGAMR